MSYKIFYSFKLEISNFHPSILKEIDAWNIFMD